MKAINAKRGEAYIDTAILLLAALTVIWASLNVFHFYQAYSQTNYIAQETLKTAAKCGNINAPEVNNRFLELKAETGLGTQSNSAAGYGNTTNLQYSFTGSKTIQSSSNVQLGDPIICTVKVDASIKLAGNSVAPLSIPISITKTRSSECYFK